MKSFKLFSHALVVIALVIGLGACSSGHHDDKNSVPIANAGADQDVDPGELVILDGSGASDGDGDPLTYRWMQRDGADVTGGSGELIGISPSFTAPSVVTTLSFDQVVNDGTADSTPDRVYVYVLEDKQHGLFVDGDSGSDATGNGTRGNPYATISHALGQVTVMQEDIYVKTLASPLAAYTEALTLSMPTGSSLYGGFGANWVRDITGNRTRLAGGSTALSFFTVDVDTRLSGFDISAASPVDPVTRVIGVQVFGGIATMRIEDNTIIAASAGPGTTVDPASSYGIRVANINAVEILNNDIASGNGANGLSPGNSLDGPNGNDGDDGGDGSLTPGGIGNGGTSNEAPDGFDGGLGGLGTGIGASGSGTFGGNGGFPGGAGGNGAPGSSAGVNDGADATTAGNGFGSLVNNLFRDSPGQNGTDGDDGNPGNGGGGGGGGVVTLPSLPDINTGGGGGGGGGAAGAGGFAGLAGEGGGASIGILLAGINNILVQGNFIATGDGGNAGDGGNGGLGGTHGNGGAGGTGFTNAGNGGNGGDGSDGGAGGDGSGGGGGPSFGIYTGNGVLSGSIVDNTVIAGNGGNGGGSRNAKAGDGGWSYGAVFVTGGGGAGLLGPGNSFTGGVGGTGGSATGTGTGGADGASGGTVDF